MSNVNSVAYGISKSFATGPENGTTFWEFLREIRKIYANSWMAGDWAHILRTVDIVREICIYPSRELLIATVCHDIDRGINGKHEDPFDHSLQSAHHTALLMGKYGFSPVMIRKVKFLILSHEVGGDGECEEEGEGQILCDANALDYLWNRVREEVMVNPLGYVRRMIKKKHYRLSETQKLQNPLSMCLEEMEFCLRMELRM